MVPQLTHHASQAPLESLTQQWANAEFSSIQCAFQQSFQEHPQTRSQELSYQKPCLAPKHVLATPWAAGNHPSTIQT